MLSLKILPFYGLSIQEFFFLAFLIQHSDNRVSFFSPKNINVRKFRVKDFALHSTIGAACTPYGPLVKKKKKTPRVEGDYNVTVYQPRDSPQGHIEHVFPTIQIWSSKDLFSRKTCPSALEAPWGYKYVIGDISLPKYSIP